MLNTTKHLWFYGSRLHLHLWAITTRRIWIALDVYRIFFSNLCHFQWIESQYIGFIAELFWPNNGGYQRSCIIVWHGRTHICWTDDTWSKYENTLTHYKIIKIFSVPQSTLEQWRLVFWLSFAISMVRTVIYSIWASGKVQSWNDKSIRSPESHTLTGNTDDCIVKEIMEWSSLWTAVIFICCKIYNFQRIRLKQIENITLLWNVYFRTLIEWMNSMMSQLR